MAKFTSENQPKNRGRKKGSTATDYLRRLSHTKINFQNPITGKTDKADVNFVVALQLILKATQDSDLPSIKEYFDRLDGKVVEKISGEGFANQFITIFRNAKAQAEEKSASTSDRTQLSPR